MTRREIGKRRVTEYRHSRAWRRYHLLLAWTIASEEVDGEACRAMAVPGLAHTAAQMV
jgi:hypothetical protein